MIKRNYFIIILLFIFSLLFVAECIFAENIGRTVYGVITETYNGASVDTTSAGVDNVRIDGSGYNNTNRIEGAYSKSVGWLNWFGIAFYTPQNMSAYNGGRIYFSAKVPDYIDINDERNLFKVADGSDKVVYFNSDNIKRIDNGPSTEILGMKINNDNQWHTYYIDLYSFINPSTSEHLNFDNNITYLFIVGLRPQIESEYDTVLIDNVYWTKAETASRDFNVTIKNVSDNKDKIGDVALSSITWSQSCFRSSWTVADQYIELDLDQESSNWYVCTYLDNGNASRNGLWCIDDGKEIVLRMAWRISPNLIPNDNATFQISKDSRGLLYDSGKISQDPAWSYAWAYFYDISDTSLILNDTTVWKLRGCHTFVYDNEEWKALTDFYERKPKIYFAADCSNALAGLTYTANIVTKLVYE